MKLLEGAGKVAHVVITDLFHRTAYRDIRVFQQPHGGVDFDFCDEFVRRGTRLLSEKTYKVIPLHAGDARQFFVCDLSVDVVLDVFCNFQNNRVFLQLSRARHDSEAVFPPPPRIFRYTVPTR